MDHKIAVLEADGGAARSVPDYCGVAREDRQHAAWSGRFHTNGSGFYFLPLRRPTCATSVVFARPQGFVSPAHLRPIWRYEPDRRRHRALLVTIPQSDARSGPYLEFFPAEQATSQSGGDPDTTPSRNSWRSPIRGWTQQTPARRSNWPRCFRVLQAPNRLPDR